jgi:hypothetical protein
LRGGAKDPQSNHLKHTQPCDVQQAKSNGLFDRGARHALKLAQHKPRAGGDHDQWHAVSAPAGQSSQESQVWPGEAALAERQLAAQRQDTSQDQNHAQDVQFLIKRQLDLERGTRRRPPARAGFRSR